MVQYKLSLLLLVWVTISSHAQRITTTDGAGDSIIGQITSDGAGNTWTRILSTIGPADTDDDITTSKTHTTIKSSSAITTTVIPSASSSVPASISTVSSVSTGSTVTSSPSSALTTSTATSTKTTPTPPAQITPPPQGSIADYSAYQASVWGMTLSQSSSKSNATAGLLNAQKADSAAGTSSSPLSHSSLLFLGILGSGIFGLAL